MNRLILADNQAIFRAGAARVLALEEDMRIVAQCENEERLLSAVEALRGAVLVVSSGMNLDLKDIAVRSWLAGSRIILVVENSEQTTEEVNALFDGVVTRDISGAMLVDCVRSVAQRQRFVQRSNVTTMHAADGVGDRVRDRLTPKEMQIVALIVQGCKNKDIATQLGTKEQVIKNYLRSIYDKSGVSDRLELALFTIHHRALAEAAAKAGHMIQMKTA